MTSLGGRYDQLIQDLKSEYRPQREWVERRGLFLVTGHFLVGIAAGAWVFGLLFGSIATLVTGYCIGALGGIVHLFYLGRPDRAWKMMLHVRTSWVSRGFVGLSLFLVGGFLYLLPPLFGGPWAADGVLADVGYGLALIGAAVMICYMGFIYTTSKAIPFWNSALHPPLYVAYAARGGVATLFLVMAASGQDLDPELGLLEVWMGVTAVVIVLWAVELYSATTGGNEAAKRSAHEMVAGRVALYFYVGILLIGLVVPALLIAGIVVPMGLGTLAAVGLASVIGDFFMKYSTIKAGVYMPLRARPPQRG